MKLLKFNPKKGRAQAMVEFALVLPILLLVVYGLIEVGRLLFIYSSVNNATRQAARWGSTSGVGNNGVPRYQDCAGIRAAAQGGDFLNAFEDGDIQIWVDEGLDASGDPINPTQYCTGGAITDTSMVPSQGFRVTVSVDADYNALVPLVPIQTRTIEAESSRTLLLSVSITPPKETTTTLIESDLPDPSLVGNYVTVSVRVTANTTPTGTVTITGADENCTITLNGSGTGSCDVRFTSIGDKTLTATYAGDAKHNPSTDTESHRVKAPSTTTITTSPNPSLINTQIMITVSVTSAWGTPTGIVEVSGAGVTCSIDLSVTDNCNATFTTDGDKLLTSNYLGDNTFFGSTDTKLHTVILPGVTITTITPTSPDPSIIGQPITVSVTVTSTSTPTGSVTISGGGLSCTITLVNGAGSCPPYAFNTAGNYTLTANYTPDTAFFLPSSDTESHTVSLPATVTTITAVSPYVTGQNISVTVTVANAPGGSAVMPTGTVTISGQNSGCTTPVTLVNGTGSCTVVFNSAGSKTLTATYSGDAGHASSTGTLTIVVTTPSVTNCNTVTLQVLRHDNGALVATINNPTLQFLQVSKVTVTWNHDKGHRTGNDKTLRLVSASLAGAVFWTGNEAGDTYTITPLLPVFIPPGTPTIVFNFHQSFDGKERWDNTEAITINLSSPGCEDVTLFQKQNDGS